MKDAILAHFKAKFPDVTLSNKRLDELADRLTKKVADENEIDSKLDDMNDLHPFAEIQKADDAVRDWKNKAKAATKTESTPNQSGSANTDDKTETATDEPPAWAKAMMSELNQLKAEKQQATMQQKVAQHEKLKGIPQSFLKGRALPDSEEALEGFVESVSADFQAFTKEYQPATTTKPVIGNMGSAGANKVDPEVQAYIDSKKAKAAG